MAAAVDADVCGALGCRSVDRLVKVDGVVLCEDCAENRIGNN